MPETGFATTAAVRGPFGPDTQQDGELFRLALEASPTGMLMVDQMGRIVLVNAQIEKLFGYSRKELIGATLDILVPERYRGAHPKHRQAFFKAPITRPMGGGRDLTALRKDGSEVHVEIGLNPLSTPRGTFVLSSVVDITERKRSQEILEAQRNDLDRQSREREVLIKEVYHRVKNNLQVISSLLNLQAGQVEDPHSRGVLEESCSRVYAIGLAHEQLHQTSDLARIDCRTYVEELADHLLALFGPDNVVIDVRIQGIHVPVDIAVPMGLVINELITNALKHAFAPHRGGRIVVDASQTVDGRVQLIVSDDGKGIEPQVDLGAARSLGLELVQKLSKQLRADLAIERDAGTKFTLVFDAAI